MYTPLSPGSEFNRTPQFGNPFASRMGDGSSGQFDPTGNSVSSGRPGNQFARVQHNDGDENMTNDQTQGNSFAPETPSFAVSYPAQKAKTPRVVNNDGIRTGFHGDVNLTPFNPIARQRSGGGNLSRRLSSSSSSNSSSGRVFLSISEFRNRQQVGIAAMDIDNPSIFLTQFADNNMYSNTLAMINFYEPVETLISETLIDSSIFKCIVAEFPHQKITRVKRKFFNDQLGMEMIDSQCIREDIQSCQLDEEKYLCLSSAGCLLKYISNDQKVFTFAPNSVSVKYTNSHTTMHIDVNTTKSQELVIGVKNLSTSTIKTDPKQKLTLFDQLNHTKTRGGYRLQRMNQLQPPIHDELIKMRQNTVTELIVNDTQYQQLTQLLPLFNDINTVCSSFSHIPQKSTVHITAHQITSILLLRQVLHIIPTLQSICASVKVKPTSRDRRPPFPVQQEVSQENGVIRLTSYEETDDLLLASNTPPPRSFIDIDPDNTLFPSLAKSLSGDIAPSMIALIDDNITSNNTLVQKGVEQGRIQVVYALKPDINGLLDVARDTFTRAIEDINLVAQQLFDRFSIPGGKVLFTNTRGYHLSMAATAQPKSSHVDVFIRRVYSGTRVTCTTLQLESLNIRQTDSFEEVCELSRKHQEGLMTQIRNQLPWLNSLAEAIAMVDQLYSFATHVRENPGYICPTVEYNGAIALQNCKHPIMDKTSNNIIPNDIYMNDFSNGLLLSGPNNSGKSTYLKQLALLVIMTQIGCYLPATAGCMRIIKHLHLSSRDNDAHHISTSTMGAHGSTSTFFTDMRRISSIINKYNLSEQDNNHALILLDEPGRNTSSEDGVAIAWAIVEALVNVKCLVGVVTHFVELLELPDLYPNIRSFALEVVWDEYSIHPVTSEATPSLTFEYKARHTHQAKTLDSYGLVLSQAVGMPEKVISYAKEFVKILKNIEKPVINTKTMANQRTNAMYTLLGKQLQLQGPQVQNVEHVKTQLRDMVKEFADEIQQVSTKINNSLVEASNTNSNTIKTQADNVD